MSGLFETMSQTNPEFVDSAENFANAAADSARKAEISAASAKSDLTQTGTNVQLAQQARQDAQAVVAGIETTKNEALAAKNEVKAIKASVDAIKVDVDATRVEINTNVAAAQTARTDAISAANAAETSRVQTESMLNTKGAAADKALVDAKAYSDTNKPIIDAAVAKARDWAIKPGIEGPVEGEAGDEQYSAKYWAEQAKIIAETKGVITFNGRKGSVTPAAGDYTAAMVSALPNNWRPRWPSDIIDAPSFHNLAFSGEWNDISNKPAIVNPVGDQTIFGNWKFRFSRIPYVSGVAAGVDIGPNGRVTSNENDGNTGMKSIRFGVGGISSPANMQNNVEFRLRATDAGRAIPEIRNEDVWQPVYFGDQKPSYTAQDVGAQPKDPTNTYMNSLLTARDGNTIIEKLFNQVGQGSPHTATASLSRFVRESVFTAPDADILRTRINAQKASNYLNALDRPVTSFFASLLDSSDGYDFRNKIGAAPTLTGNLLRLDQDNSTFSLQALKKLNAGEWLAHLGAQPASANLNVLDFAISPWALARMKDATKDDTINALGLGANGGLYYTQAEINANFYNKSQVYTKAYIDGSMVTTATVADEVSRQVPGYTYTKAQIDSNFIQKAGGDAKYAPLDMFNLYYNKTASDARYYTKTEIDTLQIAQDTTIANTYITKQDAPLTFVTQAALTPIVSQAVDNKISAAGLATTSQLAGKVDKSDGYWTLLTGNNYQLKSGMSQYYTKTECDSRYVTSTAGEAYNSTRLEGLTKAQLTQEIVNLVGSGGGGSGGGGTVVDAYTKIESDAKYYSKTQADAKFLTPQQGTLAFAAVGDVYAKTATYSQTEADNKFALKSTGVTTTSLTTTLNSYLTKTSFNTTIADYLLKTDAAASYLTITNADAKFRTAAQVSTAISAALVPVETKAQDAYDRANMSWPASEVYRKTESDSRYIAAAKEATFLTSAALGSDYYTKLQIDANNWMPTATANTTFLTKTEKAADSSLLDGKNLEQVKTFVLNGFTPGGQVDAYTKSESDAKYATIATVAANNYTKQEVDVEFQTKTDTTTNYYNKSQADGRFATLTTLGSYQTKTQSDSLYALKTQLSSLLSTATADTLYLGKTAVAADSNKLSNKTLDEVKTYVLDGYSGGGAASKDGTGGDFRYYYIDSRAVGLAKVASKNYGTGAAAGGVSTERTLMLGNAVGFGNTGYNAQVSDDITAIGSDISSVGSVYDRSISDANNFAMCPGVYIGSSIGGGARYELQPTANGLTGNVLIGTRILSDLILGSSDSGAYTFEKGLSSNSIVAIGNSAGRRAIAESVSIGARSNGSGREVAGYKSVAIGTNQSAGAKSVAIGSDTKAISAGDIIIGTGSSLLISGANRSVNEQMKNATETGNINEGSLIISSGVQITNPVARQFIVGKTNGYSTRGFGNFQIGHANKVETGLYSSPGLIGNGNSIMYAGVSGTTTSQLSGVIVGGFNTVEGHDTSGNIVLNMHVFGNSNKILLNDLWAAGSYSTGPLVLGQRNTINSAAISEADTKAIGQHITIGSNMTLKTSGLSKGFLAISIGQIGDQSTTNSPLIVDNNGSIMIGSSMIHHSGSTPPSITVPVDASTIMIGSNMFSNPTSGASIGGNNVLIGTGMFNSFGNRNIGHSNVFIGNGAGWDTVSQQTGLLRCFAIGRNAYVTGNDQGQLGDAATTVYANKAIATRSDARDKIDVKDSTLGLDFIMKLRPVEYRLNFRESYRDIEEVKDEDGNIIDSITTVVPNDGSRAGKRFHCGLIAQEVESTLEDMGRDWAGLIDGKKDGGADRYSVIYQEVVGPMIKAMQEQQAQIEELKSQVAALLQKK